jgi:tetratricopeptide (TPR) repeat protein
MKRIITLFVSLAFICHLHCAAAQTGAPQRQLTVVDLIQQGRIEYAISLLQEEALASDRTAAQRGRTYAMLGYAYQEEGKLEAAQRAFERAIHLLEAAGDDSTDYSGTLDFYAETLLSTGDLQGAATALHQAANVDARLGNHTGLAFIHIHTAELDIESRKFKPAERELASARAEAALAKDNSAAHQEIDRAVGWLAVGRGKYHDAVAAYAFSLDETRGQYGENAAVTGWSYLLLGKAQEMDHDLSSAEASMEKGLAILKQTAGTSNIRYLAGELAYSQLLEDTGSHAEAARISSAANRSMRDLGLLRCANCTVSVWTLRHQGP